MFRRIIGAGIAALAVSNAGLTRQTMAQEPTVLDPVLVTDGLTPIEQEKSGRAYTVISGEQLEKNQIRYVADALRQVPGFAVSRTGSQGGLTQIAVRGAEANQLLVMIDGVEVNETSNGGFDFGSLVVDDIDRIEILRGPQSAFWGSNASAGAINIITRRGGRNGYRGVASSETGTDGTYFGSLGLSGGGEQYDIALSGAFRRNDGFNISDFGQEKDGDRNATLNGRFNADLAPNFSIDGTARYVDRKSDVDPQDGRVIDGDDWTATEEFYGSIGATHVALDGALTQKARFTGSDTQRDNYASTFGGARFWEDGNRYNATYQASYQFDTPNLLAAQHQLTGGYEWERETFAPSHLDETFSREANSVVGEYRGAFFDQLYLNAALRRDYNDGFDDATTYSVSGAWLVPETATRLHASLGTGVTNPTFYEQFGYVPSTFIGNPNLKPEESFGWDIGIEQSFFDRYLVAGITYFNQDLTNEIAIVYDPNFVGTTINRDGQSKRQGVEVSATLDLQNGFTTTATYTYTDSTEQTEENGPRLEEVRRPRHTGSLSLAYSFYDGRARVFADADFNGRQKDTEYVTYPYDQVTLDAYAVLNAGGSFRLNDQLEIYGRIENLLNEEYEEVFDHNTPGRTAFIGLRGSF